jgi:hypothetical protein
VYLPDLSFHFPSANVLLNLIFWMGGRVDPKFWGGITYADIVIASRCCQPSLCPWFEMGTVYWLEIVEVVDQCLCAHDCIDQSQCQYTGVTKGSCVQHYCQRTHYTRKPPSCENSPYPVDRKKSLRVSKLGQSYPTLFGLSVGYPRIRGCTPWRRSSPKF